MRRYDLSVSVLVAAMYFGCSDDATSPPDAAAPDAGGFDAAPGPDPCRLDIEAEAAPAFPFDFQRFEAELWPELQASCGTSGCHLAPAGRDSAYEVWPATAGPCPEVQSFQSFYHRVDFRVDPASSPLLRKLDGTDPHTPSFADSPLLAELRAFVDAGHVEYTGAVAPDALLDFAFFARKIDPMFNDPDAVQGGTLDLTCATQGCHGPPEDEPDSGTNLVVIPAATDPADLFTNFVAASRFVHAPAPDRSSLLLYPTNLVADTSNPSATGLEHPGGACFALDDPQAADLFKFTGGLRPSSQGFLQDFLVAGLFAATDVTDQALSMEQTVEPAIFDASGQDEQYHQGLWDGYFSPGEIIDLRQAFQVEDAPDRLAYAVAYAANTTASALDIVVSVDSANDVALFVGEDSGVGRDGQGVSVSASLPPFADGKDVTRIMLKVFQQPGETTFGFDMQLTDDNGNLLTDATRELVFVLSPRSDGI